MGQFKKLQKRREKVNKSGQINKSKNIFGNFASDLEKRRNKNENKKLVLAANARATKSGVFVDNRVKSQFQNQIKAKKQIFDLQDEEIQMTHKGEDINNFRDYDFKGESENEDMPAEMVKELNFTSQNNNDRTKSRKEIYEEIIKKSKKAKFEKQKQKEDDQEKLEEINDAYLEIGQLLKTQNKWDRKKNINDDDNYFQLHASLMDQSRQQAKVEIKPKKEKKFNRNQIVEENSQESEYNDDQLETKKNEKNIVKQMRKVQSINNFMEDLQNVKKNKQNDECSQYSFEEEDEDEEFEEEDSFIDESLQESNFLESRSV